MKIRRLSALAGAIILTLALAGPALADSSNPATIHVSVSGNKVTLSGTWDWASRKGKCDAVNDRYVGWAADWDDPNDAGNAVGSTGFSVGTSSDNTVHTKGDCGSTVNGLVKGTWGPLSHTYDGPGTYHVCVLTYDIHVGDENKDSGHNRIAGGPNRNKDNSAETNGQTPNGGTAAPCAKATIVIPPTPTPKPTPKPSGNPTPPPPGPSDTPRPPHGTVPPTAGLSGEGTDGSMALIVLLAVALGAGGLTLLRPQVLRRRRGSDIK